MPVLAAHEIERALPGDLEVVGLLWKNDDRDLELVLRFPPRSSSTIARLMAEWATDLRVHLDLSGYMGVIPVWEVVINGLDRGRWGVLVDFGQGSSLAFECNDLRLEIPE